MKTTITSASSGKHQVTTAAMKTASASIAHITAAMKTTITSFGRFSAALTDSHTKKVR